MRAYSSLPRHQDEAEPYGLESVDVRNGGKDPVEVKSKSLDSSQESNEEPREKENEIIRTNSDKKIRYKSQKLKMKIKRQASVEEQFPAAVSSGAESKEKVPKTSEKKIQFVEDLKIPKIEIARKELGSEETFKGTKEYAISSPNSSKLRERFSKSKALRNDSKNLNVESSKSSDSGIGASRSTEDDSIKTSESGIFKFFDTSSETKLSKSDSEKSPNFLDTMSMFARPRSRERSVSSDSSDKNLSDIDKPSIKIRKRHEYSESRDSSSSVEGNIFDAHISNRVRRLHQVALKQMSLENPKGKSPDKTDFAKRSVDFKYPTDFKSCENIVKRSQQDPGARKFKSLERTGSNFSDPEEKKADGPGKGKARLKKQDSFEKSSPSNQRHSKSLSTSRKGSGPDDSDGNPDSKDQHSKRNSRKDKKNSRKPKRALSEDKRQDSTAKDRAFLFRSLTTGKSRSDTDTKKGKKILSCLANALITCMMFCFNIMFLVLLNTLISLGVVGQRCTVLGRL